LTSTAQSKKQRLRLTKCVRGGGAAPRPHCGASPASHFNATSRSASHVITGEKTRMKKTSMAQELLDRLIESRRTSRRSDDAASVLTGERITSPSVGYPPAKFFVRILLATA
jgi:hypothetical protein